MTSVRSRNSQLHTQSYIKTNEWNFQPLPPQTSSFGFEITRQRWGPEKSSGPKTRTGAGNNGGIRPDIYYISIYEMTGACQWASRRLLKCKRRHRVSVRAATTTKKKKKIYQQRGRGRGRRNLSTSDPHPHTTARINHPTFTLYTAASLWDYLNAIKSLEKKRKRSEGQTRANAADNCSNKSSDVLPLRK